MTASRTPVLMYHRVGEARSAAERKYCIHPDRFAAHMRALALQGYRAVPLSDFLRWLQEGGAALRDKDFVLTFDDGFQDVLDHAVPILAELSWPFTIFLVTHLLGDTDRWNHTNGLGGQYPLLKANALPRLLTQSCELHSHTMTHRSLTTLDDQQLRDELEGSRARLVDLLGEGDYCLAYPYGHVDARVEAAARRAGYRAAFSVQPGFNRRDVNPYQIRRLDVFGSDTAPMLLRKIHLGSNDGGLASLAAYYLRQATARLSL